MSENKVTNAKNTRTSSYKESVEAQLKQLESLAFEASMFFIGVATTFLCPIVIFFALDLQDSNVLTTAIFVLSGICGLLIGVANYRYWEERRRKRQISELRAFEKEFFEMLRRDLSVRLTT